MKLSTKILSLLVLFGLATFYISCDPGGGDDKTEAEKQLIKLNSNWTLQSANDGSDRTADFPNLKLEITGTYVKDGVYNYKFTGTRPNPSPWPANGTWKFGSNVSTDLIRDPSTPGTPNPNEIDMTYTLTDTQLEIKFNIPTGSTGWAGGTTRERSVTGDWTFTFVK
jgi:hypothetical protein